MATGDNTERKTDGKKMVDKIAWAEKELEKSDYKYKEVQCPFLENGKCTIYEKRPSCCRNYPHPAVHCDKTQCAVAKYKVEVNTADSSDVCTRCKDLCCSNIRVPVKTKVTKETILDWLEIDCEACEFL